MIAAVAVLLLALLLVGRLYQVSRRRVARRDAEITKLRAELTKRDQKTRELSAELALTKEACDRQTAKARHLLKQAQDYRDDALRLSERNGDLRDQLDIATGAVREPSLVEEITAWLGTRPTTNPEDQR